MSLKIYKEEYSSELSEANALILKHITNSVSVCKMNVKDTTNIIISCLQYAYKLKGFGEPSAESVLFDAKEISKELHKLYKGFTEYDLKYAVKLGALGELKEEGDLNNISIEMVLKWIKRYNLKVRNETLVIQKKFLEQKEKEFNEEEFKKGHTFFLQKIIDLSLDENLIELEPIANLSLYFDHLRDKKIIELTKDEYTHCHSVALNIMPNYKETLNMQLMYAYRSKEEVNKSILFQLCKKIGLKLLFSNILKQNKKLIIKDLQLILE